MISRQPKGCLQGSAQAPKEEMVKKELGVCNGSRSGTESLLPITSSLIRRISHAIVEYEVRAGIAPAAS